jgi:hypothetical protein
VLPLISLPDRTGSGNFDLRAILVGLDFEFAAKFADPFTHASEANTSASTVGRESLE